MAGHISNLRVTVFENFFQNALIWWRLKLNARKEMTISTIITDFYIKQEALKNIKPFEVLAR